MKGQSLAVETVFTVGLGIVIATGTITLFGNYRSEVTEESTSKKGEIVVSKLESRLHSLEAAEYGSKEVQLPEELSGDEYTVSIDDQGIEASNSQTSFETRLEGSSERLDLSGSATGGSVTLYKTEDEIVLRGS